MQTAPVLAFIAWDGVAVSRSWGTGMSGQLQLKLYKAEARKLEHAYPHAREVKFREPQHESSLIHVPTLWLLLYPKDQNSPKGPKALYSMVFGPKSLNV